MNLKRTLTSLAKQSKKTIAPYITPFLLRLRAGTYAPFVGAGIKITHLDLEKSICVISMPLTRLNKNIVGTQFGGSLFAMTDPFFMIMLMHKLGSDYVVWDKSSSIDFISPAKSQVSAHMALPVDEVSQIVRAARGGDAVFRHYDVEIFDANNKLIAKVHKTLYIRLRKYSRSSDQSSDIHA